MKTPFTGGCSCGAIRYESTAEPIMMFKCHCRDCQQATGGISANARTIALPFYAQHQTREAQAGFLSGMRISNYGRRIRSRGLAVYRNPGRQPRRSELVSATDGHFRLGRPTVGQNGSQNSEIRTIPANTNKGVITMQKITPFLWFDHQAEEAAKFYTSVFKNSKVGRILRYDEASAKGAGRPVGSVLTIEFEIAGQKFTALNGGPEFKFNESISFVVNCETQNEVDYFWEKLMADGGQESQCGWLKDKFGVSWQITPTVLIDMLNDKDAKKAERVMKAMMQMQKIDIKTLKEAYAGK